MLAMVSLWTGRHDDDGSWMTHALRAGTWRMEGIAGQEGGGHGDRGARCSMGATKAGSFTAEGALVGLG